MSATLPRRLRVLGRTLAIGQPNHHGGGDQTDGS
jgi:hypothetical protein